MPKSKELAVVGFDYGSVDADTKGKLLSLSAHFVAAAKAHCSTGIDAGKIIADAHELLAGDGRDGKFKKWISQQLGISRQTAYNMLWSWQRFGKCKTVLHLFDQAAIYLLASPKVPDEAVSEAKAMAEKGEKVSLDAAKSVRNKYRKPKAKKKKAETESPPADAGQTPPWPCLRTGGDHKWGPDEDRLGKQCCQECGETEGAPELPAAKTDTPVLKLFAKLNEHMGKSVRLLDDINRLLPDDKLRKEIFDSLEVANEDILKWKKGAKK